jgi:hypothetical protein
MSDHIFTETQTAGFGLANRKVVHKLVAEIDRGRPAIVVRHVRVDHPDPHFGSGQPHETTIDHCVVVPTGTEDAKLEIGTRHGRDRVRVEYHSEAPRAYVRHERAVDGAWREQRAWELHPATGVQQVAGEPLEADSS